MHNLTKLALLGTSLALTACMNKGGGSSSTDLDSAASAVDSSDSTEAEGNMMMASVDGADMTSLTALTGDQVAAAISANVALRWIPSACATVAQSGANITVTYADCTGPRGLVHVTGELDLAITVSLGGSISVHATSTDLEVNGADLDIDATGEYAVSGTTHTLTVDSKGSGTGPRGNTIDHQGDYTISWDSTTQCHSIMGSWSTDFSSSTASAERSNEVDLSRCGAGCPTGTLTHHFLKGQSVTVTFDGSAVATFATSGGVTGSVNLSCTAQ